MASTEQVERLKRALKDARADARAARKEANVERRGRAAAEKERDAVLKENEKLTKAANAAEEQNDDKDARISSLERQLRAEMAFDSGWTALHRPRPDVDHAGRLDQIIGTPQRLKSVTGCTPGQFKFHLEHFEAYIRSSPDMPLFRGDTRHTGKPGNRCKLYMRHHLLLVLARSYTGTGEERLQTWFGVDQSNISRYLDIGYRILGETTITADFMTDMLMNAKSMDDVYEIIRYFRILIDGTHIQRVRPGDSKARKAAYSGKKKQFTFNVQVITNHARLILGLSAVVDGSTHDYTLFKGYLDREGAWLKDLARECRDFGELLKAVVDLGYQGMKTDYGEEFEVVQGTKRKRKNSPGYEPKHGGLTKEEREHNKEVSRIRIPVEHAIGGIKRFRLMRGPYAGSAESLRFVLNAVTGLANTNSLWDHARDAPRPLLAKLMGRLKAGLAGIAWT